MMDVYNEAKKEYGQSFSENVAFALIALHPEHSIDGVAAAAALTRQGMNLTIIRMMGLTVSSMAHDFSKQSGDSVAEAKQKIMKQLLKECSHEMYLHGSGMGASFDGAFTGE